MRTLDQEFTIRVSRLARFRRDLRVLLRMTGMLWGYFRVGGRVRRAYRTKETRGQVYWIDESTP